MELLNQHKYPLAAWVAVALGHKSPDARVLIDKFTPLPDRCGLTFSYRSEHPPEMVLLDTGLELATSDFYAGEPPIVQKVYVIRDGDAPGSLVMVEWRVLAESAIYRAETRTLYICAPTKAL